MKLNATYIFVILATIATIAINALANILPFNGVTTAQVSDQLRSYFVPAGYVFSIWGVIYLLLLTFSIGYITLSEKQKEAAQKILPLYFFSAFLNSIWIVLWHYGFFLTTVVVIVTLLVTLIMIYQELSKNPPTNLKEKLILHVPFSVYLAWGSVATIANTSSVLWLLNWNGFGIQGQVWAAVLMIVAGILAVITSLRHKDLAFSAVIVWAITGIMVKFPNELPMRYAGIAVVTGIVLVWATYLFKWLKTRTKSKK